MSQVVPILKKKHNKTNKKVSFGQTMVKQVSPYKEENKANTITKKEVQQARHEVKMENIVNKVRRIQEEERKQEEEERKKEEEKRKWDEDIEQRKKEYLDFLKKNKDKYGYFLEMYEENKKKNTNLYDYGGNTRAQTRKIRKNRKTYKNIKRTGVSTIKNRK